MKSNHTEIKLRVIHAALNMAVEDAFTFVESTDGFDPEGYKEAVKQYNRALRAKEYFYQLFTKPCAGSCSGCSGCGHEEDE